MTTSRSRPILLALSLVAAAGARGQEPAGATATVPGATPTPASPPSAPPSAPPAGALGAPAPADWTGRFSTQAGWGYYEVTHVGAAWHFDDRGAFGLFGGYGFTGGARTATLGLSFAHDLFQPVKTLQPGWTVKAIYWSRSDDAYDWTNVSLVLGAYVAKDVGPRLRLALDGGVALTGNLTNDRKQNVDFGHPERWNGSVCLEIAYLLGAP